MYEGYVDASRSRLVEAWEVDSDRGGYFLYPSNPVTQVGGYMGGFGHEIALVHDTDIIIVDMRKSHAEGNVVQTIHGNWGTEYEDIDIGGLNDKYVFTEHDDSATVSVFDRRTEQLTRLIEARSTVGLLGTRLWFRDETSLECQVLDLSLPADAPPICRLAGFTESTLSWFIAGDNAQLVTLDHAPDGEALGKLRVYGCREMVQLSEATFSCDVPGAQSQLTWIARDGVVFWSASGDSAETLNCLDVRTGEHRVVRTGLSESTFMLISNRAENRWSAFRHGGNAKSFTEAVVHTFPLD